MQACIRRHVTAAMPVHRRQTRVARAVDVGTESVDPAYAILYIENVCEKARDLAATNRCISTLYIPPIEVQRRVIDILRETAMLVDISDILGPGMSLLSRGMYREYEELVNALIAYQASLENLRGLAEAAVPPFPDIPSL